MSALSELISANEHATYTATLVNDLDAPVRVGDTVCLGFSSVTTGPHARVIKCTDICPNGACATGPTNGAELMGPATHPNYVCRKCIENVGIALTNRHACVQPPCTRDLWSEVGAHYVDALAPYLADYDNHKCQQRSEWMARWSLSKRDVIETSLRNQDVNPGLVTAMIKVEGGHTPPTKARLIQFPTTMATQALFGPEFASKAKVAAACFDGLTGNMMPGGIDITFGSGYSPDRLSQWFERVNARKPVAWYERDGKAWDSTMQRMHLKFRVHIASLFSRPLADFIARSSCCVGQFSLAGQYLKYYVAYTVKSGHNDTTDGNSHVNSAIAYAVFKEIGVSCSILVNGDDLLVAAYDPFDESVVTAAEAAFGIRPEARVFTSPIDVSFCSAVWAYSGRIEDNRWYFVPNIGRQFARLFWSTSPPPPKHREAYVRGIARGLRNSCSDIPVLRALLRTYDTTGAVVANRKCYLYKDSQYGTGRDHMDWFCNRYSCTEADVRDCEDFISSLAAGPQIISHPLLRRIMDVDLCDIDERAEH